MTFRYGYRYGEVVLPKIEPWKADVRVRIKEGFHSDVRKAVSATIGCHFVGAALPHADPEDPATVMAGALKRFCYEPPTPVAERFDRLLKFVKSHILPKFTPLSPFSDLSVDTWLKENNNYTQTRKDELKRKYEAVRYEFDPFYTFVKSFVKDEDYPAYKHARCINSRSDEFKCFTGPIFHTIEKELFKRPEFIKYVPVPKRPDYLMERLYRVGAKYAETDYTSCEAHFDQLRLKIEFLFYEHMTQFLPTRSNFLRHLHEAIAGKNKCIFKWFVLWVKACRMSGEMNTSLGNGFVNWVLSEFLNFEARGSGYRGVFEGDDGAVVATPLPSSAEYKELGFTVKMEPKTDISHMSFCGMVFDPEDKINITNPIDELLSFGWTPTRYVLSNTKTKLALLRAKSISMLFQYSGCPVLHALAVYGLRVTKRICVDRIVKYMNAYEKNMILEALKTYKETKFRDLISRKIGTNTRLLMEQVHGITIEHQIKIEAYLNSLNEVQPLDIPEVHVYLKPDHTHYYHSYVIDYRPVSFDPKFVNHPPVRWNKMAGFVPEWSNAIYI